MAKNRSTSPHSPSARLWHGGRTSFAVSGLVAAVLLALGADALAAGFGEVQVASQLGERLYARVPLVGDGAADVATECVKLIPDSALQDAPALSNPRVAIDRKSTPPAVVVSTPAPVMDPAVRFVLELGCGNRLRREFVLLIDPPDLPQIATGAPAVVPPAARVIPADEPRWGSGSAPVAAASSSPAFDAPLAEPPVATPPAPAPRKVAPKPRPKPATPAPQAAQARPAPAPSAPPPPVKAAESPKPAGADRLVLADSDPVAARPAAEQQQEARDAREEALTRQIEALTKEVAKMREDMDKMAVRNRELAKEAESSKTGWFAAGGLGIVLAGLALGAFGRREKKSWRDDLAAKSSDEDDGVHASRHALPEVREEMVPEAKVPATETSATSTTGYLASQPDTVTDLDVTKLRVHETGLGGSATTVGGTTLFPEDILASWNAAEQGAKRETLQSLDFSLDDVNLGAKPASAAPPVFQPKADAEPSEAARNALFEQIDRVHQASKKS